VSTNLVYRDGVKYVALVALLSSVALQPPSAVDQAIERLATCQDSWREWKDDPVQSRKVADLFNSTFVTAAKDGSFAPNKKVTVVGLPVLQVYPESLGMGVGFSVIVAASFDVAREHVEKAVGKKLADCDRSDGMRTCGLEIAKERTITLMAGETDTRRRTLVGCYYLYEK
jgi:hypothetical protein